MYESARFIRGHMQKLTWKAQYFIGQSGFTTMAEDMWRVGVLMRGEDGRLVILEQVQCDF